MTVEDVIGAFRNLGVPNPAESHILQSPSEVYNLTNDDHIKHYYQEGDNFSTVLNVVALDASDSPTTFCHLFLFNGSIWVQHEGKSQSEFVKQYFDKSFSQFSLNSKGNTHCPLIYSMEEFRTRAGEQILLDKIEEGKITSVSVFDLDYGPANNVAGEVCDPPTNLINYPITDNLTLLELTQRLRDSSGKPVLVGFFSQNYDGSKLNKTRHHVQEFWGSNSDVNFFFPSAPYSQDSLFSFEFGTLAEALRLMTSKDGYCKHLLLEAQNEIASRYLEIKAPNKKDAMICGSSLVYFTSTNLDFQPFQFGLHDYNDSSVVRSFKKIPALNSLSEHHPNGFTKKECSDVEKILKRIAHKSLNFLNMIAHNPSFEHRDILFAVALSIFDYLAGRDEPLSDEDVLRLKRTYEQDKEPPFPGHLFRYLSVSSRPKIALSKTFQAFKVTTTFVSGPDKNTQRTLHYLGVLRGEAHPPTYRDVRRTLYEIFQSVEKVKCDDGLNDCLGFDYYQGSHRLPHCILLLNSKFSKIMNKVIHRFHVIHNQELKHLEINGNFPRTDLWVGPNDSYFMTAAQVNEGLEELGDYLDDIISHPMPFRKCDNQIDLEQLTEPNWLVTNLGILQEESS